MFEILVQVAPSELDLNYQHIHHAIALRYWEQARLAFLLSLGFPTEDYIKQGLFWVVASIQAQYRREIKAGNLRVTCTNARIEGKSLLIDQQIYNERGKLAVEGAVNCMLLSRVTGRSVAIPTEFCAALRAN